MANAKHDEQANKNQSSTHTGSSQASPVASSTPAAAPAATEAPAATPDERYKKLTLDDAGSTFAYGDTSQSGKTINRIDYIRSAWTVGKQARGAIAKELSRLSGKKVTYQIVFSATKGVAGGPAPAAAAPAAAA